MSLKDTDNVRERDMQTSCKSHVTKMDNTLYHVSIITTNRKDKDWRHLHTQGLNAPSIPK
jgi:hypothetical protein